MSIITARNKREAAPQQLGGLNFDGPADMRIPPPDANSMEKNAVPVRLTGVRRASLELFSRNAAFLGLAQLLLIPLAKPGTFFYEGTTMTMHTASVLQMSAAPVAQFGSPRPTVAGSTIENIGDQKTVAGKVESSKNGDGTFFKAMEEVNGQKTVDKTVTFANGKSKSTERAITINDDGSKTISKTGANGKTSTIQESSTQDASGSTTFTREKTAANGNTTEVSGVKTQNADGSTDGQITKTNASGQTETLDRETTRSSGYHSTTTTGTGYGGNQIANETSWTELTA
jgi:hypothetical protein